MQDIMKVLYRILAVLDLAFGLLWNMWSIFWFRFNDLNSCILLTRLFVFPTYVTFIAIMACISGISFSLYLLVSRPLRFYSIVTPTRFRVALLVTSLLILLISGTSLPFNASPFYQLRVKQCIFNTTFNIGTVDLVDVINSMLFLAPVIVTFALLTVISIKLIGIVRQQSRAIGQYQGASSPPMFTT